jgi:acetyltransferase
MTQTIAEKMPKAKIEGVTVQPMFNKKDGMELILGIKRDPIFGTCIMVGMGGTTAELFKDKSLGFPPLNERLARRMLENLKIYPILQGYRGSKPQNIDKLIEVMIRLSYLAADYPEIEELDINPLLITPEVVIALDARIVLDQDIKVSEMAPFSHLVLRPYPERYVKKSKLGDGQEIILRPIMPEDEPLWLEMLGSCSKESIYSRFRYDFHFDSHEIATQFCYIDYARELGIVAEIKEKGKKRLIGVGRLITDADFEVAEYAVLVIDEYQKKELGTILTKYCTEIAADNKLKRIVAYTTRDNQPMIQVFKKIGFKTEFSEDNIVTVSKDLQ